MALPWQAIALGLQAATYAYGSYASYRAGKERGEISEDALAYDQALQDYENQIAEHNASFLDHDISVARRRGYKLRKQVDESVSQIQGSQKAVFAGRNISVESSSVMEFLDKTERMGDIDTQTIIENTQNDVFALQVRQFNIKAGNKIAGYQQASESDIQSKLITNSAKNNRAELFSNILGTAGVGFRAYDTYRNS